MDAFTQRLQEWQLFYATLAAACATLTGLLFVSLSMIIDVISSEAHAELMRTARQAFANFLFVLSIALLLLVPRQVPVGLGVGLLVLGGFALFTVAKLLREALRAKDRPGSGGDTVREFALPVLAYFGLIAAAIAIMFEIAEAPLLLFFVDIALLVSASRNAWMLLMNARRKVQM
jgi:hypothetical protein